MITIRNITPPDVGPFGVHDYELRINDEVIVTFSHKRTDGLAKCLLMAAAAVEKAKWEKTAETISKLLKS